MNLGANQVLTSHSVKTARISEWHTLNFDHNIISLQYPSEMSRRS